MSGRALRLLTVLAATLSVTLGAAACGAPKDEWAGLGAPIEEPTEPAPPAPNDRNVEGMGGLRVALESRVVAAGGLVRPVKSDCDTTSLLLPTFDCRITYLDEVVTYRVTTERRAGTTSMFTWEAKPDAVVATRAGIEAELWRKYATRASEIRCDPGLPDKQRVPSRTTLPNRCYFKPIGSDVAFGKDSSNRGRTVAVEITVRDGGMEFTEKVQ